MSRGFIFVLVAGACVLVAAGYVALAGLRTQSQMAADAAADPAVLAQVVARPHVVFLHSTGGDLYRRVAVAPLEGLEPPRYLTPLQCQRVHVTSTEGLCLGSNYIGGLITPYNGYTFDRQFQTGRT